MKKLSLFLASVSMLVAFSSCNKEKGPGSNLDLDDIVLDGFYVFGEATGSDKVLTINAMSSGINEVTKEKRAGMYEKYIWLEADKDFSLIEKEGASNIFYGAELKEQNFGYDANDPECLNFAENPNMKILQGRMIIGEDAPKMKVKETAMYHIVLDNNKLGDLDYPQIIIQKCIWGIRGNVNDWTSGWTESEQQIESDGSVSYVWTGIESPKDGAFKFLSCEGWKINLDLDGKVKAETSLGAFGGKLGVGTDAEGNKYDNIPLPEPGIYEIKLSFAPKAGAIGDAFTYTVKRTGESNAKDYSSCELELVGNAVMEGPEDTKWNGWGHTCYLGKPAIPSDLKAKAFTWCAYNVKLTAGEDIGFKVRTLNAEESGGFGAFDFGEGTNNMTVEAEGTYDVIVTIDAYSGEKLIKCETAAAGSSVVEITANVTGWDNPLYMWTWVDGVDDYFYAGLFWPCLKAGDGSYKFTYRKSAEYDTVNGILINGSGWGKGQTNNFTINETATYSITGNGTSNVDAIKQ